MGDECNNSKVSMSMDAGRTGATKFIDQGETRREIVLGTNGRTERIILLLCHQIFGIDHIDLW
jgi:hypothetical protein